MTPSRHAPCSARREHHLKVVGAIARLEFSETGPYTSAKRTVNTGLHTLFFVPAEQFFNHRVVVFPQRRVATQGYAFDTFIANRRVGQDDSTQFRMIELL